MIAIWLGPVGMGLLGQFMSLSTIISVFAGGGIATGITKYTAEYRNNTHKLTKFLGAAASYGLLFSGFLFLISIFGAEKISMLLFGEATYSWLVPCLGIAHFFCFVGAGVVAVINGHQLSNLFARLTISSYLPVIPISYFLISNYQLEGAIISLLLAISCTGLLGLVLVFRSRLTRLVRLNISNVYIGRLAKYSLMMIASATIFPLAEIVIRTEIISDIGQQAAGLWQAMTRLSGAYMGFFTVFLATNYMPKLSALFDGKLIVREVEKNLIHVGILFFIFSILIYQFRFLVIDLLFTKEFYDMDLLFGWQLLGDFFRISSYVIGFLSIAKSRVVIYVIAECIQSILYVSLSMLYLKEGAEISSVAKSYALAYFLYFCSAYFVFVAYKKRVS